MPQKNGLPSGVRKHVIGQPPCPVSATVAFMYTASRSGRSSRSTLMFTNPSFIAAATWSSSNDSWAITWHQWHAAYPTDSRIGTSRAAASASASGVHCCQCTGLSACWRR